jgi:hypothetical protein
MKFLERGVKDGGMGVAREGFWGCIELCAGDRGAMVDWGRVK